MNIFLSVLDLFFLSVLPSCSACQNLLLQIKSVPVVSWSGTFEREGVAGLESWASRSSLCCGAGPVPRALGVMTKKKKKKTYDGKVDPPPLFSFSFAGELFEQLW